MKKIVCYLGLMGLLGLMSGCKTVYVPVESDHHDTLIVSKVVIDSVYVDKYLHDSVYIHDKGDTVLIEKWHTQFVDKWREKLVYDTVVSIKVDSIQVPYPVEKKISFWKKTKMIGAGFISGVVIAGAVGVVLWIRRRYKRC